MSVQTTVEKELESLRNSVKREPAIKSNIFDCEAVINHIQCMETDGTPLPPESPYTDFAEWKEAIGKEKKGYESQLLTIAKNKDLITAYEKYLTDNPAGV